MNAYCFFVRGEHHANLARTSIESVRKADPLAVIIVVTDEPRHSWKIDGVTSLCVESGQPIMLANLEAQIAALNLAQTFSGIDRITFLDTDTLFLRIIPDSHSAHVTFTWRDSIGLDDDGEKVEGIAQRMPYNYGVITARPCLSALECFIWIRERIRVMHESSQKWYGNQLAVAELAGPRPESGCSVDPRHIPWRLISLGNTVMIGKLPCEIFNYTPQQADEDVSGKYVLHFKGKKRHLMETYAKRLGLGWYVDKAAA